MTDIVYKACREYIVELKRLPDTITNEGRDGVIDRNYAKFRGNKFFVHSIKHKITKENIPQIENTQFSNKIKYIVGEEISTEFCENLNEICADGIHFFTSFDAAYYYIDNIKNGIHKKWHDNGQLMTICNYKDGIPDGKYSEWDVTGKQSKICNYKNGILDGEYGEWYVTEKQSKICNYKNGKLDGDYISWYENGKPVSRGDYKVGQLVLRSDYKVGELVSIGNYKDGQLVSISNYKDGMKMANQCQLAIIKMV